MIENIQLGYMRTSNYTISILDLLASYLMVETGKSAGEIYSLSPLELCQQGRKKVFSFDYPFYKEEERERFETNFLMHFLVYEIGSETFQLWFSRFYPDFMAKIDRFNKLYLSTLFEFEPLENTSVFESFKKTTNEHSKYDKRGGADSESGTKANTLYSDLPQTILAQKDYGTNYTENDNTVIANTSSSDAGSNESHFEESYEMTKRGNIGVMTYDQLLTGYRASLINVDNIVYEELMIHFLQVF